MSGSSLDKLEGRVRSAVQEAQTMREQVARLQVCVRDLTADRDAWKQRAGSVGQNGQDGDCPTDQREIRRRLQTILGCLDQIERQLDRLENQ